MTVDKDARERIRTEHTSTLFVEAGAGTGKTTALVSRLVEIIRNGSASINQIAAITFTDAAARELNERIEIALRSSLSESSGAEAERLQTAITELDTAVITTLHGFAQRILAEFPLAADVPARFRVAEPVDAATKFNDDFAAFMFDLAEQPDSLELITLMADCGLSWDHAREIAQIFHDNYDRLAEMTFDPSLIPEPDPTLVIQALDEVIGMRALCRTADDTLGKHLDTLSARFEEIRGDITNIEESDEIDALGVLNMLADLPIKPANKKGKADNWSINTEEVRQKLYGIVDLIAEQSGLYRAAILEELLIQLRDFTLARAEERRELGELEFHDLLVLALKVLKANERARATLHERYAFILIDEFQDTDPLQAEIAALIASSSPAHLPWSQHEIQSGQLFVVGDPNQSIYRFRRADHRMYQAAIESWGADIVHLRHNFRSVPPILDAVNFVHNKTLSEHEEESRSTFVPLEPHRKTKDFVGSPVAILGGEHEDESMAQVRVREANEVAALVAQIIREQWTVTDRDGSTRAASLRDICMLLPTRAALAYVERALEDADIPLRIESQVLLFATNEVHELMAILRAIAEPTDQVAFVAALRTSILGCSDLDLANYRAAGGSWDWREPPPTELFTDHPVVESAQYLRSLAETAQWTSASDMLSRIITDRNVTATSLAHKRPRDRWRRMRFLIDYARSYAENHPSDVHTFVECIDQHLDENTRMYEAVESDIDDDAVRINTMHGAKGLEYPIVILAGMNAQERDTTKVVWTEERAHVAVGSKDTKFATRGYEIAFQEEGDHIARERDRLLYVAMTRARDHLIMSLHYKGDAKKCMAGRLANRLEGFESPKLEPVVAAPPSELILETDFTLESASVVREHEFWVAEREKLLQQASVPTAVTATLLSGGLDLQLSEHMPYAVDGLSGGGSGAAFGRAVHEVMHFVSFTDASEIGALAAQQAANEGIADRASDVVAAAESLWNAPAIRRAAESRSWREVPVFADLDGIMLEGFIDLLVETPDGFEIIDYKTDHVLSDEDIERLLPHYRLQVAAYAEAVSRILGQPIARAVLIFSGKPAREVVIQDLDTAREEVVQKATQLVSSPI